MIRIKPARFLVSRACLSNATHLTQDPTYQDADPRGHPSSPIAARLLIIDDEPSLCQLLEIAIRKEGYKVETTTSGQAALKKIDSQVYDLIVSDIRMPDLSGIDLLTINLPVNGSGPEPKIAAPAGLTSKIAPARSVVINPPRMLRMMFSLMACRLATWPVLSRSSAPVLRRLSARYVER